MKCALCNYEFDQTSLACHTQCPLGQNCSIICCPNCGYQTVDESKSIVAVLANKVRQKFGGEI